MCLGACIYIIIMSSSNDDPGAQSSRMWKNIFLSESPHPGAHREPHEPLLQQRAPEMIDMDKAIYKLKIQLLMVVTFMFVELIGGLMFHSLALVSDSFHMVSDAISLVVGIIASRMALQERSSSMTYGWARAELLGGLINGCFLVALCLFIITEAVRRALETPIVYNPQGVLIIGSAGLTIDLIGVYMFYKYSVLTSESDKRPMGMGMGDVESVTRRTDRALTPRPVPDRIREIIAQPDGKNGHCSEICSPGYASPASQHGGESSEHHHHHHTTSSYNLYGVFLHLLSDMLGSVVVVATGAIMMLTEWKYKYYTDPIASILISILLTIVSVKLITRTSRVLLQSTPRSIDSELLKRDLLVVPGVHHVHELHTWQARDVIICVIIRWLMVMLSVLCM